MFDFATGEPDPDARASATVIALRDADGGPEVLLMQRNPALRTMGGAWVFPGGKVDPEDPGELPEERARHAAVRELREEACLDVPTEALEGFSHWLTPIPVKARFATWFYVTALNADVPVTVDGSEMVAHRWVRPFDAIDAQRRGEWTLPPPTLVTLCDLGHCQTAREAVAMAAARKPPYFFPKIVHGDDAVFFLYPGDVGYHDGDPERPGKRHRTIGLGDRFEYVRDIEWVARDD